MQLSAITAVIGAVDNSNAIGINGRLPWRLKSDLKHFKRITADASLIMGRKTFESLPLNRKTGLRLPGRHLYVASRTSAPKLEGNLCGWGSDLIALHRVAAERAIQTSTEPKVFIIGGSNLWDFYLRAGLVQTVYLSAVLGWTSGDGRIIRWSPQQLLAWQTVSTCLIDSAGDECSYIRMILQRPHISDNPWERE